MSSNPIQETHDIRSNASFFRAPSCRRFARRRLELEQQQEVLMNQIHARSDELGQQACRHLHRDGTDGRELLGSFWRLGWR